MHRRHLPIAAPCHADWNTMEGDAKARFCLQCTKHVHNLSEMPRLDAAALLLEARPAAGTGEDDHAASLCVRYRFTPEGEIQFATRRVAPSAPARQVAGARALQQAAAASLVWLVACHSASHHQGGPARVGTVPTLEDPVGAASAGVPDDLVAVGTAELPPTRGRDVTPVRQGPPPGKPDRQAAEEAEVWMGDAPEEVFLTGEPVVPDPHPRILTGSPALPGPDVDMSRPRLPRTEADGSGVGPDHEGTVDEPQGGMPFPQDDALPMGEPTVEGTKIAPSPFKIMAMELMAQRRLQAFGLRLEEVEFDDTFQAELEPELEYMGFLEEVEGEISIPEEPCEGSAPPDEATGEAPPRADRPTPQPERMGRIRMTP
jgi:hypothetical protein